MRSLSSLEKGYNADRIQMRFERALQRPRSQISCSHNVIRGIGCVAEESYNINFMRMSFKRNS